MAIYAIGDAKPILPPEGEYWIAPNAQVMGNVQLEKNASVWFGAVLRGDKELITIGHMVMLHGCTIGAGSLVGIGSIILNNTRIGKGCLIGANTLIAEGKDIPDYSMVLGAPGKIVRTLDRETAEALRLSSDHYVQNWKRYASGMKRLD